MPFLVKYSGSSATRERLGKRKHKPVIQLKPHEPRTGTLAMVYLYPSRVPSNILSPNHADGISKAAKKHKKITEHKFTYNIQYMRKLRITPAA
jgi:hypothetical protein